MRSRDPTLVDDLCSVLISVSVFFTANNFNKFISSIYLGNGLSEINEGKIEAGIKSLEKASRSNNRSEVIETELFKISYKVYQVEAIKLEKNIWININ